MSECPAIGVGGVHSDGWHEGGQCAWCGAANRDAATYGCDECTFGYCIMNMEDNRFEIQACDNCASELSDTMAAERFRYFHERMARKHAAKP